MPEVIYNSYAYHTKKDGTKSRYRCKRKFIIKTRQQGIPIDEAQQQELVQLFNKGVTYKRLAEDYNISTYYVRKIIDTQKASD